METRALIRNLGAKVSQFVRAEHGNTMVIFAFCLIPLVGMIGAAVDYSRANAIRTAMQAAADATALAISKTASTQTAAALQSQADTYFRGSFTRNDGTITSVSATYSNTNGSQVVVNATATMNTSLLGVWNIKTMQLGASSTTAWGNTRLRVALVLDNTGSMADSGKIQALQTATKNLINQLKNAATTNGDVYVSIIPFSRDVNVGSSNYNASWIDWTAWDSKNGYNQKTCTGSGNNKQCTTTWIPASHSTWNGCVTDRGSSSQPGTAAGNDQTVTAPVTGDATTLFPADQYGYCPLQMMGLSYDWTTMTSLVDLMYPNGSTNQPIGLVWGWQSLVGGGPLTAPPMDSRYTYQQVIILLSDGLNTQDRWYGNGYNTSTSVDYRMYYKSGSTAATGTCQNIKNAGITIYTIQVNTSGDPTSVLLQNCASSTDKFFLLTSANEIVTTFNQIGTNLTKLRVAK